MEKPNPKPPFVAKPIKLPRLNEKLKSNQDVVYTLESVLGEGAYGTVFRCSTDDKRIFALKVEDFENSVLNLEIRVLKALAENQCKHFCQLIDSGVRSSDFYFLVMTLLNTNLSHLRIDCGGKFLLSTTLRIALQTLDALKELHSCRYISRDVKPSNFAPGLGDKHDLICMFDFGLARRYINQQGVHYPARTDVGFRGTLRYGSLASHLREDLGRKADLESWFYMIVEFNKGTLPWRRVYGKENVYNVKKAVRTEERRNFLADCPQCYDTIMSIIDELNYESEPPYSRIESLLVQCYTENNIQMKAPYEWEEQETSSQTTDQSSDQIVQSDLQQKKDASMHGTNVQQSRASLKRKACSPVQLSTGPQQSTSSANERQLNLSSTNPTFADPSQSNASPSNLSPSSKPT